MLATNAASSSTSDLYHAANPLALAMALNNEAGAAQRLALVNQFLRRQQIEKHQKALLAQHFASLTGSASPLSENAAFLALLRKKQIIDQQVLQQKQLQELRECLARAPLLEAIPHFPKFGQQLQCSASTSESSSTAEALAVAGLTGLSRATSHNHYRSDSTNNSAAAATQILSAPPERRRNGRSGKFPQKLHQMLADLDQQGRSDIASFVKHGRAFAIHKPTEFAKEVMAKYFRMSRFSSFQRQLNLYDFQRITEGSDKGAYCVSADRCGHLDACVPRATKHLTSSFRDSAWRPSA